MTRKPIRKAQTPPGKNGGANRVKWEALNMATKEKKELGNELPLLVREFEILEIKPAKKRAAKPGKSAKRAKLPGEPADAPESDDDVDPADKETDGLEENSADGDGADDDAFDIAISSEYPVQRWYGTEILDHSSEAVESLPREARTLVSRFSQV
jgi:hypothetical protein